MALTAVQHTSAPRHGRRFEPTHETALHEDALAACGTLPGVHRGIIAVKEMTGPIGIPDFTAMVGGKEALRERSLLDVRPILNEVDAAIVAASSPRVARTVEVLAGLLGWPVATVARRISGLEDRGALLRAHNGRYFRPEPLQPTGRLYAIEAKVRDRVAGVYQARNYLSWADSYVLVMGELGSGPLESVKRSVLSDKGGLMVAGTWIVRPRLSKRNEGHRLWASEHFYAAIGGAQTNPSVLA